VVEHQLTARMASDAPTKELEQTLSIESPSSTNIEQIGSLHFNVSNEELQTDLAKSCNVENEEQSDEREFWNRPKRNIFKLCAAYYGFLIFGMSDSSIGVLLPSIEPFYGVSYQVVSLAFLAQFFGYLVAALFSEIMHRRMGKWGVCVCGTSCQLVCYIIAVTRPPFPVYVIGYGIAGFGNGTIEAAWNSWLGSLNHANEVMGLLHGFYGLGGIVCPAVFTAMIGRGISWNICYSLLIGMSALSVTASTLSYWGDTPAKYRERISHGDSKSGGASMKEVMRSKVSFSFFYCKPEVLTNPSSFGYFPSIYCCMWGAKLPLRDGYQHL
jgi:MFS family permease